jgi:inward rectifier potassium channel
VTSSEPAEPAHAGADDDLGFGRFVSQQARGRFLMRDGKPTARKFGLGAQNAEKLYLRALQASWLTFFAWTVGLVLFVNGVFALAYTALGENAIVADAEVGIDDPFLRAFVFSVSVFTTNGTSALHASGTTANWLVVVESLFGPITLVIAGGLLLARLIRPRAQLRFSESAVIAPYEDGRAFMFRMVNVLPSELSNVAVTVNLSRFETLNGVRERNFHTLSLERTSVAFFPLHWTVVHPIVEGSPLFGVTPESLRESEAEFVILVTAHEDTFSTQVSVRTSYLWDEVSWDVKFASIFSAAGGDGVIAIDVERLDRLDRLPEGTTRVPGEAERVR